MSRRKQPAPTRELRAASSHLRHPRPAAGRRPSRPVAAYRLRGAIDFDREPFYAPENWHEPTGRDEVSFVVEPPGRGFKHPVTVDEIRDRIALLPERFRGGVDVVQLSRMTRKRALFPNYGMQWGPNVYLYPIEESLVEPYARPPRPEQIVEARMFGGKWIQDGDAWLLEWTAESIRDFYLNNVLIHEIGHVHDDRNTRHDDRERFANWFAIEYGYRASRGRR